MISYEDRIRNILIFIKLICIQANGYDLKRIINNLCYGEYKLQDALVDWLKSGNKFFYPWEEIYKEFFDED